MRRGIGATEFRERLAYARWVRQLTRRDAESDREFATEAGVGYDWLQKWKKRVDAPQERKLVKALCAYLALSEDWLIDAIGEAPRPELFAEWIAAYRWSKAHDERGREPVVLGKDRAVRVAEDPRTARKRAAGGRGKKS